ncbi:MAG: GHKL domain-containing protein [Bacteroidales bacterium]|nr:GHKL domain-containing protein [Bacteroidales bacterium]
MNKKRHILQWLGAILLLAAVGVFAASFFTGGRGNVESAAAEMGFRVKNRLHILDKFIDKGIHTRTDGWMELNGIPEDMVVYRYVEDTLQSWANQFPIRSDDIRPQTLVNRLGDSRGNFSSPLKDASEALRYVNHGPKWYLEKKVQGEDCVIIAGLEIVNELQAGSLNGINRNFGVSQYYTVRPLSEGTGVSVMVDGTPLFKLTAETLAESNQRHSTMLWFALGLLLSALLLLLGTHPTPVNLAATILLQGTAITGMYLYGRGLSATSQLFSPLLYADGPLLYALGAVVLINLGITLLVLDVFLSRRPLLKALREKRRPAWEGILSLLLVLLTVAVCVYMHLTFRSITVNSSINLELYKVGLLNGYTAIVYLSFLALSLSVPLLLQMLSPLLRSLTGLRYDVFSPGGRLCYAVVTGVYFVAASSTFGFQKEQRRIDVWANRLAMSRDIALEIQLRSVENAIASDPMIGALSVIEGSADIIQGRLVSAYMGRISQDYDIAVQLPDDVTATVLFQDRIRSGVRLGENSHFFYSAISSGRTTYTGLFTYYVKNQGSHSVLVTVESKHNREDRGYLSLLGISDPGRVSLPPVYSWAKYVDDRLVQYKGLYPYPTVYSDQLKQFTDKGLTHVDMEGWCHFMHNVSEGEIIVISRPGTEWLYYVVEGVLLAIVAFLLLSLLAWRQGGIGGRRYYQTRISLVMYISLIVTLVAMAGFSVWFVYKRNNADMESIMTARINSLQSMLQERLRQVEDPEEIRTTATLAAVEGVGNNLKCDISLFDLSGRVVMSTTPEVYDRMILGHRLDDAAYMQIMYVHKRFYMHRERVGRRSYYALYAPVMNSSGRMVAIVSSPFTDITHDLETEAILHIATVITIFLLLLMISRFITFEVVSRMFRPIAELRRKMTVTDVDHLEPLEYKQDDEITPLVQAYNRMVRDLGESSRRLAQVERDKAWTDMARRVAHDLKNPLTPIKLQLQMLMRMKATGNPAWEERFDEVAQTVLYHVDLLADSADQFSTFAKMYDQKAERLDLDALIRQEVDLFDSRDDIQLDYFGLADAFVEAPRPQLTRVVVNLITNAIQAVDGIEGKKRLVVSLRNAVEDGFYDIVVEDNGPGVDAANQDKIFTPDFTTKTSGSGLGLAICRRIVEHCGGSVSYSKSFNLGGACFTVKYPKA